ncbi:MULTISPECIES: CopG family transcriptional regulator [Aerococcus]|uniref:CopG family transcriptional regulator n=2 Tax=Aerococcus urinae TaxID=1376 RepID=A0ABT4C3M4_9LACT|nr:MULTISPECIES: CopG family transcriptional regulator [Aerococcus]MCY3032581.1 CopG family transcriptional regulator [Aerococcus urinae]MCY3037882.1 CopG family transcriptional regulator [Aerococcus urinae]MCY3044627.1 CopG family transcriptional regulator [Aerococcus urinae]MCY3045764.1 CopG family transcriptional regulator [Aerococcus urinae]MCY3048082.1 CopG family transcriptional regulator [Aerococcus urinae]
MKSSKMGRPKAKNPLNVDVKVRIDEATNEQLLAYCKKHNITRTEAIRKGIQLVLKSDK